MNEYTAGNRYINLGGIGPEFAYHDASELREFVTETNRLANRKKLGNVFDSKSMLAAIDNFGDEASKIDKRHHDLAKDAEGKSAQLERMNEALIQAERALADDRGLRGRTWFKHQIYAPGFYTGYAALPFPDLRQAIEDGRTTDAAQAADRITEAIRRAAEVLRKGRE